ncbi:hypothetical protein [Halobaculum lipolyticum]|uniref:DUF2809 domain-containing protein n=1 Tax=Halobaculum lipolyticum TaxID=3032001 RepID=A0ABD5WHN2_9EURY|nr:hypothetical protein [Halobaculum sp. DT31]
MIRERLRRPVRQIRADLRDRRARFAWAAMALWSLLVAALHFGGLAYDVYTAVPWWDLLTHSMSGFGVAALLWLSYCRPVRARAAPLWLVPTVFLIGVGFEVYEYLFKSFWWEWSLRYYAVDTAVDLVLDAAGAAVVVAGHVAVRSLAPAWPESESSGQSEPTAPSDSVEG